MPEKKERFGQGILSMALANFDSWVHSPRTVLMLIFIIAICYLQMCGYKTTLNETGYTMHMGETLFYEFNFGVLEKRELFGERRNEWSVYYKFCKIYLNTEFL